MYGKAKNNQININKNFHQHNFYVLVPILFLANNKTILQDYFLFFSN